MNVFLLSSTYSTKKNQEVYIIFNLYGKFVLRNVKNSRCTRDINTYFEYIKCNKYFKNIVQTSLKIYYRVKSKPKVRARVSFSRERERERPLMKNATITIFICNNDSSFRIISTLVVEFYFRCRRNEYLYIPLSDVV